MAPAARKLPLRTAASAHGTAANKLPLGYRLKLAVSSDLCMSPAANKPPLTELQRLCMVRLQKGLPLNS